MSSEARNLYDLDETFYVPHFEVKLRERDLPRDVVEDVISVTYHDAVNDLDRFDLVVNNWDGDLGKFKYEPPSEDRYDGMFDPGQTIELSMGYISNMRLMLTGEITSLEPDFPASGGPTISVRGLNVLHRLRATQHSHSWEQKTDSDIAKEIGDNPVSKDRPGLGVTVKTNPLRSEETQEFVLMENQYDIVFLLERARRHDYELVLYEKSDSADRHIYFGPSRDKGKAPKFRLEWGKTLTSFRPTLSTSLQIKDVTVRATDRKTNSTIEGKASWDTELQQGPLYDWVKKVLPAFDSRSELVTKRPVHTQAEADSLAKKIMRQQLQNLLTGSGSVVGLPSLRAGGRIQIVGFGRRFDANYYVTETTHTIGAGGYQTSFSARLDIPNSDV
jgi:phage protein D